MPVLDGQKTQIKPSPRHVNIAKEMVCPSTLKGMQAALGCFSHHRSMIPQFSLKAFYLQKSINFHRRNPGKKVEISDDVRKSFNSLKTSLINSQVTSIPTSDPKCSKTGFQILIYIDSSIIATAAVVIIQYNELPADDNKRIYAFFSKLFSRARAQSSAIHTLEFLGLSIMIEEFYYLLNIGADQELSW